MRCAKNDNSMGPGDPLVAGVCWGGGKTPRQRHRRKKIVKLNKTNKPSENPNTAFEGETEKKRETLPVACGKINERASKNRATGKA